jgi:hypothetical protein
MKCGICGRDSQKVHELKLTKTEREYALKQTGEEPPDKFLYCSPCWRILQDKNKGAALIRSMMEVSLRARGVTQASKMAQRMHAFLIEKAKGLQS